jgi:hypothetical protein
MDNSIYKNAQSAGKQSIFQSSANHILTGVKLV